jgi:hypothetical protein
LFLLGGLAACGDEENTATPTAAMTATVVPTAPSGDATPRTGGLTVGSLADRIGVAWSSVSTYRAVTTTNAHDLGTPRTDASPVPAVSITDWTDEVVLPDRKRRIATANGVTQYELIAVGGKVYARGPAVPGLDASRPDPDAWVEIDTATLPGSSDVAEGYADFAAPVPAPYSGLSAEERGRDAMLIGETSVEGRTCLAYGLADTTNTGERIEVVLSLGSDDLPCSIETRAGGLTTTTAFTYNLPIAIEAPAAATPSPSAT